MRRFPGCTYFAVCLLAGCLHSQIDAPTPPPEADVARIARQALRDYAAGLAESFTTAADQLHAGELTTAAEANARMQAANAAARKAAFQSLDAKLNDMLGGDRWDADQAERLFREIAEGLRLESRL